MAQFAGDGFRLGHFRSNEPQRKNKREASRLLPRFTQVPEFAFCAYFIANDGLITNQYAARRRLELFRDQQQTVDADHSASKLRSKATSSVQGPSNFFNRERSLRGPRQPVNRAIARNRDAIDDAI